MADELMERVAAEVGQGPRMDLRPVLAAPVALRALPVEHVEHGDPVALSCQPQAAEVLRDHGVADRVLGGRVVRI